MKEARCRYAFRLWRSEKKLRLLIYNMDYTQLPVSVCIHLVHHGWYFCFFPRYSWQRPGCLCMYIIMMHDVIFQNDMFPPEGITLPIRLHLADEPGASVISTDFDPFH